MSYFTHNNPLNTKNDLGGKGGCFKGETQISMADGSTKAIKDIQKGDKILTKESEFSGRLIPAEVVGKTVKHVSEYLVINETGPVCERDPNARAMASRSSDWRIGFRRYAETPSS